MTPVSYIYDDMIEELRQSCRLHTEDQLSADKLQRVVQRAEATIVAVEEKDVRSKMTDTEGQLELVKFMVEDELQVVETHKIAKELLAWLDRREQGSALA